MDWHQELKENLDYALDQAKAYLEPYGLTITAEEHDFRKERGLTKLTYLGEYERGSVFEKDILTRIDLRAISDEGENEEMWAWETLQQVRISLFHEMGHALFEQLIDWSENLEEVKTLLDGPFGERYFNIFNDDNVTEEELVEKFAWDFENETSVSLLKQCWEEINKIINV